ncbi:hypothetical protein NW837_01110 [Synechococcus sp. R6-10]|uniref:hypothetical protein n=1 Tax=Synechococcus sp. R6-10 TaxID=2291956 RepID=UPI0039C164A6
MATAKKPPKKKLPTGPTKADLLSRMGVNKQPEPMEPAPTAADGVEAPHRPEDNRGTDSLDLPHPAALDVEPDPSAAASSPLCQVATTPPEAGRMPLLASVLSTPEAPSRDADPLSNLSPAPVEVERVVSPPQVSPAKWAGTPPPTEGPAELLPPATAGTGNGVRRNGAYHGHTAQSDPREALDAQLGLQKLTLKWSAERVEKLGSLESATGLPGEILLEVLLDHWEQLPKPLQQDCLLQAHRIRVERLVISQNFTIATIEQLLFTSASRNNNEQHLL